MTIYHIYLAGGMGKFGKEKFEESNAWRVDIKNQLENICCNYKVKCCNPNDHFNFLKEPEYLTDREVMEFDLHRVRKADLVIVNFNDIHSLGTMAEIATAYEMKKPVLGLCEDYEGQIKDLHPWQKCMVNRLFTDREDLVLYVLKHYLD